MNLGDMRTELQARGFNYLSPTRCNYFLNNAHSDLCEADLSLGGVWPFLTTTTTGTAPLTLTDLRQVMSVVDSTSKISLVEYGRQDLLEQVGVDLTLTGSPAYWYLDDEVGTVTNLVTNPSFEVDTTGWSTTVPSLFLNGGATLTRTSTQQQSGGVAGQVVTTNASNAEGVAISLGALPAGTYSMSAYFKGNSGGELVKLIGGSGTTAAEVGTTAATLTTSWQRVTGSFIADAGVSYVGVQTNGAQNATFFIDAVQVTSGTTQTYFDGDSQGCFWTGAKGLSSSVQQAGDVLRTYPVSSDSVSVRYVKTPPTLVADTDTPLVPDRYCDLIVDGAVIQAYMDSDNLMSAYALKNTLDEKMSGMADSLLFSVERAADTVASVAHHADWD